jgi:dolichol kinase
MMIDKKVCDFTFHMYQHCIQTQITMEINVILIDSCKLFLFLFFLFLLTSNRQQTRNILSVIYDQYSLFIKWTGCLNVIFLMMIWGIGYAELVHIEINIFFLVLLIISDTCTTSIKKRILSKAWRLLKINIVVIQFINCRWHWWR